MLNGWILILLFFSWGILERPVQAQEAHPCAENVGYGPLDVDGQSFYQMLHLNPTPAVPSTLPAGQWEARFSSTWVNDWAVSKGRYFIDSETVQFTGKINYAVGERLQAGVAIPFLWRGGGVLDQPIEGFHRLFGIGNLDREKYPRNRLLLEFHREDGSTYLLDQPGIGLEDLVLSTQYTLTCGGRMLPAAALNFSVSLPTGDRATLYGTGGADFSVALLLAKRIGDFYFYLNGAYVWLGNRDFVGIPLKSKKWTVFSGVEYRRWSKTSLILQNTINSGIARDDVELSQFSDELIFGIQHALSRRLTFELALIENLFHFKNSPDFGAHVGMSYRF